MESWNDYLWPLLMLTDRAKMTLPIALSTLNGQYNTESVSYTHLDVYKRQLA